MTFAVSIHKSFIRVNDRIPCKELTTFYKLMKKFSYLNSVSNVYIGTIIAHHSTDIQSLPVTVQILNRSDIVTEIKSTV
jgi:hypothetical protein